MMAQKKFVKRLILVLLVIVLLFVYVGSAFSFSSNQVVNTGSAYSSSGGFSTSSSGNSQNIKSESVTTIGASSYSDEVDEVTSSFEELNENKESDFIVSSDPDFGDLWVKSSPEGAEVYLNEFLQVNKTPFIITMLNPGEYTITVKAEGFESIEKIVKIVQGKTEIVVVDFDGEWNNEERDVTIVAGTNENLSESKI